MFAGQVKAGHGIHIPRARTDNIFENELIELRPCFFQNSGVERAAIFQSMGNDRDKRVHSLFRDIALNDADTFQIRIGSAPALWYEYIHAT